MAQVHSYTGDDSCSVAAKELSKLLRAQLCGMEYLLSEVVPLLSAERRAELTQALASNAADFLRARAMATFTCRPWKGSAVYTRETTCAAVQNVLAALQVASLPSEVEREWDATLVSFGRPRALKNRWQAHQALQPWCVVAARALPCAPGPERRRRHTRAPRRHFLSL